MHMKKLKAERAVTLYSGQVELTAEQAKDRQAAVKAVKAGKDGAGTYEITSSIMFKAGEVFGYDGDIGKDSGLVEASKDDLKAAQDKQSAFAEERAAGQRAEQQGRDEQAQRDRAAQQDKGRGQDPRADRPKQGDLGVVEPKRDEK
jgi:hypothetical protein